MNAVEFSEKYVKVRTEQGPQPIVLDDLMSEFADSLTCGSSGVIARYPRQFGKTTALLGYVLMNLLMESKVSIGYSAGVWVRSMRFLQSVAYSYRCLPKDIIKLDFSESPDRFMVGNSRLEIPKSNLRSRTGYEYDIMIYDDLQRTEEFDRLVNQRGKTIIVGTFDKKSEFGKVWKSPPHNWISLPTDQWKVDTILSICNPMLTKGY